MKKFVSILLLVSILMSTMTFTIFASSIEYIAIPSQQGGILTSDYCALSIGNGWTMSTSDSVKVPGVLNSSNSWYTSNRDATATYKVPELEPGNYGVYLWNTPYGEKTAELIDIVINASGTKTTVTIDGDKGLGTFKNWIYLGSYYFSDNENDCVVQGLNENSVKVMQRATGVKFVKDASEEDSDFILSQETVIIPSQNEYSRTTAFSELSSHFGSNMSKSASVTGPTGDYSWYSGYISATARYKASAIPSLGEYGVYVYMTPFSLSTADKMDVTVTASGVSKTITVDGLHGGDSWKHWYYLGKYYFNGNSSDGVVQKINPHARALNGEDKCGNIRTSGVKFVKNDPNINGIGDIPPVENITLIEGKPYYLDCENSGFAKFGSWSISSVPTIGTTDSYSVGTKRAYALWMINPGKINDVEISFPRISTSGKESDAVEFEIYHSKNLTKKTVDFQNTEVGWYSLGKFDFAGDGTEYIKIISGGNGNTRVVNVKLAVNEVIVEKQDDSKSILFGTDLHIFERMGMFLNSSVTDKYLDTPMSRADMTVMLTRLFGRVSDIRKEGNTANYVDVASDFWAKNTLAYIKAHPEFGIKGHGKNTFSPNSFASKTELIKFLLHQLGYYEVTDYKPEQAYSKANELGITTTGVEKLTPRTMGKIILSAFDIPLKNSEHTFFEKLVRENSGVKDAELFKRKPVTESLLTSRNTAKNKNRGLIYNNDGNDIYVGYDEYPDEYPVDKYVANKEENITKENFLAGRTVGVKKDKYGKDVLDVNGKPIINDLKDTTVDSIFYCTGVFNSYTHISDETDIRKRDWSYLLKDYTGKDTLHTMAEYGSENNFEVFWSMRMNDTHDYMYREDQLDSWKQANLDKLVSKKEEAFFMPYGNFRWSSIDYTYNESRQKVYDILKDVVSREEYNLSGIELDFTRFPIYFKEVTQGIDVYPENIERMNDLMRMIRALVDMYSVENGNPILLSIYVPDSIKYCKAIGLDIKTWLDEKLIDLVVVGETNRFQTWAESVAEYEPYNVPVYAAFDDLVFKTFKNNNDSITYKTQTVNDNKEKIVSYDIENEAAIAWNEGVDGIYIYNLWFNPAYADKKSFFYTLGDKEKVLNAHDTEYITFAKGADSISKGYVKNTADYATEALKNSITPNEAKQVIDGINNLPETSKLKVEDKASVESIETAYEVLTDAQKLRVTNYQKLKDVRKELDKLLADLQ